MRNKVQEWWDEEVVDGTGQTADGIRKVVRMDFR